MAEEEEPSSSEDDEDGGSDEDGEGADAATDAGTETPSGITYGGGEAGWTCSILGLEGTFGSGMEGFLCVCMVIACSCRAFFL